MKTKAKNSIKAEEVTPQNAIDESPLTNPSLEAKDVKKVNKERKKKKDEDKASEWKI